MISDTKNAANATRAIKVSTSTTLTWSSSGGNDDVLFGTSIGSEPTIMLTGPAAASRRVLKRCGMKPDDIDLYEINEAFACVVLRYQRDMGLAPDKVNVNGGAIALGHPLGMTGTRLLLTLALVIADLEQNGDDSVIVQRLTQA